MAARLSVSGAALFACAAGADAAAGAECAAALTVMPGTRPECAAMRTVRLPAVTSSSPKPVLWTSVMSRCSSLSSNPPAMAPRALSADLAAGLIGVLRLAAGRLLMRSRGAGASGAPRGARGVGPLREVTGQGAEREQVAGGAEPLDDAHGATRDERGVPERLARV